MMEQLKLFYSLLKRFTKKPLQKVIAVILTALITLLLVSSCGTLSMKGTNEYEYYRKGKNVEKGGIENGTL